MVRFRCLTSDTKPGILGGLKRALGYHMVANDQHSKTCRNRVWRSEIEASADDDRATSILRLRQEKREICRCPTATHLLDDE